MKILYKFPCRERVLKMFAAIDNIHAFSETKDWSIFLTLDMDDEKMRTRENLEQILQYGKKVKHHYGTSTGKIHAVNRDMELAPKFDIVIVMSDDMRFIKKGFDATIVAHMKKYFPDTDGILHYPDGSVAKDKLCTMSIMGRKYYERFNYLYNPVYKSVYADDEYTQVARKLGKHQFIDNQLFKHNHPIWDKDIPMDDLYRRNEEVKMYRADAAMFEKRKKVNFDL